MGPERRCLARASHLSDPKTQTKNPTCSQKGTNSLISASDPYACRHGAYVYAKLVWILFKAIQGHNICRRHPLSKFYQREQAYSQRWLHPRMPKRRVLYTGHDEQTLSAWTFLNPDHSASVRSDVNSKREQSYILNSVQGGQGRHKGLPGLNTSQTNPVSLSYLTL